MKKLLLSSVLLLGITSALFANHRKITIHLIDPTLKISFYESSGKKVVDNKGGTSIFDLTFPENIAYMEIIDKDNYSHGLVWEPITALNDYGFNNKAAGDHTWALWINEINFYYGFTLQNGRPALGDIKCRVYKDGLEIGNIGDTTYNLFASNQRALMMPARSITRPSILPTEDKNIAFTNSSTTKTCYIGRYSIAPNGVINYRPLKPSESIIIRSLTNNDLIIFFTPGSTVFPHTATGATLAATNYKIHIDDITGTISTEAQSLTPQAIQLQPQIATQSLDQAPAKTTDQTQSVETTQTTPASTEAQSLAPQAIQLQPQIATQSLEQTAAETTPQAAAVVA
jgi:hypothetical protein